MYREKTLTLTLLLSVLSGSGVFKNWDSCTLSEPAHRRGEVHVLVVHHKTQHPTTRSTAETMKGLAGGIHVKRRGLLLMERTNCAEARPRALEREIRSDQVNDIAGLGYALDSFFGDKSHPFKLPCDGLMRE